MERRSNQQIISENLEDFEGESYPTFLAIASWFALHDCRSCWEDMDNIVNPADKIEDYDCAFDGYRLLGFDNSTEGVNALRTLRGLGCDNVFIHDGSGNYIQADEELLNELDLTPLGALDITAGQETVQAFITNMLGHIHGRNPHILPVRKL